MPSRLGALTRALACPTTASYQPLAPFLYPWLMQQRSASILSSLSDNKGAYNKAIRRGRGPSSGKGKTSGRGHKGQKQHGKVPAGFNGGQTPDEVVAGKRGFENIWSVEMSPINLNRIQYWINQGRLDPTKPITVRELNRSRAIHGVKDGVKLLARGKEELSTPINIFVSRASQEAIKAVEAVGGTVTTRYYSPFALKKITAGEMDPINSLQSRIALAPPTEEGAKAVAEAMAETSRIYKYRLPDPVKRKDIEYYRDAANRGYLRHLVKPGQTPSLFFKTPGSSGKKRAAKEGKLADSASKQVDSRLW